MVLLCFNGPAEGLPRVRQLGGELHLCNVTDAGVDGAERTRVRAYDKPRGKTAAPQGKAGFLATKSVPAFTGPAVLPGNHVTEVLVHLREDGDRGRVGGVGEPQRWVRREP